MKRYDCKDYEITCLSPVHIGCGETLGKHEYLWDKNGGWVYFIQSAKLQQLLERKHLLNKIVGDLEIGNVRNLWGWLQHNGCTSTEIKSIAKRKARGMTADQELNNIALQSTLADGRLYIPGSTIKGALRTAILVQLLQKKPQLRKECWQELKRAIASAKREKDISTNLRKTRVAMLEKTLFFAHTKDFDAVNDVMRGLMVGDATACEPTKYTIIQKKLDSSYKAGKIYEHGVALYRECIPAGTKLRVRITLDKAILKSIGIDSLDEIIAMAQQYYQQGLSMQKAVFQREYPQQLQEAAMADLILGGGTGFLTKTIFYALADSTDTGRMVLKDYFDKKFRRNGKPSHDHVKNDTKISPRTLKLTEKNGSLQLMGLCTIKEITNA